MAEEDRKRVVIVGGGIAGMETALALHHLAPGRAEMTLIAPEPEFNYKPMVVVEPFTMQPAERRELAPALEELGGRFVHAAVVGVDTAAGSVVLADDSRISYDFLVVALGGRARPPFLGTETFWAGHGDLPVDELLAKAAQDQSRTLAFVVPGGCSWPLPLYELALMTRRRLDERGPYAVRLLIVTPEAVPLAIFGAPASDAVAELLRSRGLEVKPRCTVAQEADGLRMHPGGLPLEAGAVVALPVIEGPALPGLPLDEHGFVVVDTEMRVVGEADVYAAGDGTTFPVKQGGIATQQADAAAEQIAARLGVALDPHSFEPVLRGKLITGADSLNLRHSLTGGHGEGGASLDYLWWPPGKVAGRYLAPWLAGTSPDEDLEPPSRPLEVEVSLPREWHGQPMAMGSYPNPVEDA
jgi:sulfide:quinone oxidoreductase